MLEIMRQARLAGAKVVPCGAAPGAEQAAGSRPVDSLAEAIRGTDMIICPVPGVGADESLWAPHTDTPLRFTHEALKQTASGCVMFFGRVPPGIGRMAGDLGIAAIGHGDDEEEALMHAVPTAEGAVRHAIDRSDVTLLDSKCVCTGFGRVGQSMAFVLRGMGARVTLCVRNARQRARAWGFAYTIRPLDSLVEEVRDADFIFQSAPGQDGYILTRDVLAQANPDVVIIELSSPPSGTDLEACAAIGLNALWARGQAGSAPKTTGFNEWQVICRLYAEELGRRVTAG
jgi:dipicolinate synthase subunit A